MTPDLEGSNPYLSPERAAGRPRIQGGFQDRRTALAVFGVFEILLGLFSLGLAVLVPVLQTVGARALGEEPRLAVAIPSMLVYGIVGAILIALGVGSIRCRRWARNLMLVLAWAWLISGLLSLVGLVWLLPGLLGAMSGSGELPEGAATVVTVILLGAVGAIFVILPAVLVLFYRTADVKATCEALDPGPDWTEACPLPVLTVAFWLAVTALFMLVTPISANGVIPVFGVLLAGLPGYLVYWTIAVVWAYGAWKLYRLSPRGWWVTTGSTVVLVASYAVSFFLIDPVAMYELMGYSERELAPMKQMGLYTGRQFLAGVLLIGVPTVGYLVYLKKYFPSRELQRTGAGNE
jgi:hypothetical protein